MKITLYTLCALVLALVIQIGISPILKLRELEQTALQSPDLQTYTAEYETPVLSALAREKAFKESLLKLPQNDSIHLVINLRDSVLLLTINGVNIHRSALRSFDIDPLLARLSNQTYLGICSSPLYITGQEATIVKEPIVVRQAPKDPVEAALNAYEPDTLVQNPAFLRIGLAHGIRLVIDQEVNATSHDKWVRFKFRTKQWTSDLNRHLLGFFTFQRQLYTPTIRLRLPADELRSVYRALPDQSKVVLTFPGQLDTLEK